MEKDEFYEVLHKKYCEALINFGLDEAKKIIIKEFPDIEKVTNMETYEKLFQEGYIKKRGKGLCLAKILLGQ